MKIGRYSLALLAAMAVTGRAEVASLPADALRIELDERGAVKTLAVGPRVFAGGNAAAGLFVRDGVKGELASAGLAIRKARVTELANAALRVSAQMEVQPDRILVSGVVEDMRCKDDRCVDVVFRLPFSPAVWWGSISETVPPDAMPAAVKKRGETDQLPEGGGVLERIEDGGLAQNYMPIACVTTPDEETGVVLAIPPDAPCRFRFAHLRKEGCLELQFLFGLSRAASPDLKGRAPFRFLIYPADGHWGLRDALQRYYGMFPDKFQRRTQASGLWLLGSPLLKDVPDPTNYAFWQASRLNETGIAQSLGLEIYPYTITGVREIGYLKSKLATYDDVLAALVRKPETTKENRYPWDVVKSVVETSGLRDAKGRLVYRLRNTWWNGDGVAFPVNPSPYLPASNGHPTAASHTFAEIARALNDHPAIHGIFVDSLGMWGSYDNHRREHFAATRAPLSHDGAGRACLPNWLPHVDYLQELHRRIGRRLVFANGIRPGRAFCAFECDVCGMEVSMKGLETRRDMDFLRAIAGSKPTLCLLYYPDEFSRKQTEEYVQRFIALGLAPEMRRGFPQWGRYKDRDADLYERFMPVYRRLDRAGWQPVTHAVVKTDGVWIERFGTKPPELYFSLYNDTTNPAEAKVAIDYQALGVPVGAPLQEIVENRALAGLTQPIALAPHTLRVIQVGR